jgi:hypothetical protein
MNMNSAHSETAIRAALMSALLHEEFQTDIDIGRINASTIVFEAVLTKVVDYKADRFEMTLEVAWHAGT